MRPYRTDAHAWGSVRSPLSLSLSVWLALMACAGGRATSALATVRTCDPFGIIPIEEGRYIVQQNEWNSTDRQCIAVSGRSWTITQASFDLPAGGPPASYPSVFRGCHWGTCTAGDALPIRIAAIAGATSSWRTSLVDSGAYDVSYDLWTNTAPSTGGQPDGSEIMIWLDDRGAVRPAGSPTARVRIAGARWSVWTTRMASWNYVAYRRRRPTRSVSGLDVAAFIHDSVGRGLTDPSWYLVAVEAGFEIWQGGRGLATRSFSFNIGRPSTA